MKFDKKILLGVLGGAALGAIAGILFAPEKGAETRRKISAGAAEIGEKVKDEFDTVTERIKGKLSAAGSRARDLAR